MCIINEVTPLYLHVRAWYVANVGQGHRKDKRTAGVLGTVYP